MSCVKTAEPTDMPFGLWTRVSTGKHGLGGSPDPTGDGAIFILANQQLLHPFNGLFSRTTWVSVYQKGKTSVDLNKARHDGVWGWQWHQLDDNANNLHLAPDR